MKNPYTGYTEKQHCRGYFARNGAGFLVEANDPTACQWCPIGVLQRENIPMDIIRNFWEYINANRPHSIVVLNDRYRWTFAQFRKAWTEFMRSKKKARS